MSTRRGQAITRRVSVTIERRSHLLWGRPTAWSRDRMRLLLVRVKTRRVECAIGNDTFAQFDRTSGEGLQGAEGRRGERGHDTVDASDWRLSQRDRSRWYAPAPEPLEEGSE